ncbi:hypothetical protein Gbem_1870 [Citrifermentans bemidjiense Bem]|uniref:Gamma-glutamylcyclotransferase n=1 Tax=Citrifermentans bemidjiense (strain ATCC BAA-1014 / DSM 16622 / JCM 12645 / Bem) TaxID=404380 RepID=B5EB23_CITBB|nr:gamma-glutamylcyclotransferase family protein [Citrifermentans bemidjiense]ACH38884.1 hypothetical protein Gbem_1870 [Citrifermentans bemidjiense Bem]
MKPYFAYGSNLWLKQMRSRCPGCRTIGAGVLIGYRWIITTRGYASVVRSVADVVFGTVYALSEEDEGRLDHSRGCRRGTTGRSFSWWKRKRATANDEPAMQLIESYCKVHPQESFRTSATEMARTLFYSAAK